MRVGCRATAGFMFLACCSYLPGLCSEGSGRVLEGSDPTTLWCPCLERGWNIQMPLGTYGWAERLDISLTKSWGAKQAFKIIFIYWQVGVLVTVINTRWTFFRHLWKKKMSFIWAGLGILCGSLWLVMRARRGGQLRIVNNFPHWDYLHWIA